MTIATLDDSEENASATAAILGSDSKVSRIRFISPSPAIARRAVESACVRLECAPPADIEFAPLGYWRLLSAFSLSRQTYSTHVLIPGIDPSGSRAHVHLTHGSGPKPDKTFRGPTNVLASVVGVWIPAQLDDYGLPASTPVIPVMPRLEIMRRAREDRSIISRLGLDDQKKLVVWAPTYRSILRPGGEVRVSGIPMSKAFEGADGVSIEQLQSAIEAAAGQLILKIHPFDADTFQDISIPCFADVDLESAGVTAYELFGIADLLITDYSSVYTERAALGLPYGLFCPDIDNFERSYRGFRDPHFKSLTPTALLENITDVEQAMASLDPYHGASINSSQVDDSLDILQEQHAPQMPNQSLYDLVENTWK